MSFVSTISRAFRQVGSLLKKAWNVAEDLGISDEILEFALKYVRIANTKYVDNAEKREWVVKVLTDRKVPEWAARLAVELAVGLYKAEVAKLEPK